VGGEGVGDRQGGRLIAKTHGFITQGHWNTGILE
jgi:hypothetical protein